MAQAADHSADANKMVHLRQFFVSMIRGKRVALLAGPFETHDEALTLVEPARKVANTLDPWSHFDLFGTLSTEGVTKLGTLNARLGVLAA